MSSQHSEEPVIIVKRRPTRQSDPNLVLHTNPHAHPSEHPETFRREEPSVEKLQHLEADNDERPFASESSHSDSDSEVADAPVRKTCNPESATHYRPVKYEEKGTPVNDSADIEPAEPVAQAEKVMTPKQVVTTARPGEKVKQTYGLRKKEAPASAPAVAKSVTKRRPVGKKLPKVSIKNVEKMQPIPGGVNTPRSLEACERLHINPSELCPFPLEHFKGPRTTSQMAELRYHSYDKRRKNHMEELLRIYTGSEATSQQRHDPNAAAPAGDDASHQAESTSQQTDKDDQLGHEDVENQRQFEAYNKRLNSASGNINSRRPTTNRSPRLNSRVISPRSGAAPSVGAGSIASMSPSAVKIQSHYRSQGRKPTQSELIMMSEIEERDMHRWETMERAQAIKENQQILTVEDSLEKERKAATIARNQAFKKENRQEQMFKEHVARQTKAEQRRQEAEYERQKKLQGELAEKEERTKLRDPYAGYLARRSSGGQWTGRKTSKSVSSASPYADRNVADDAAEGLGASPEEAHEYEE